jgi:hypothetical protein
VLTPEPVDVIENVLLEAAHCRRGPIGGSPPPEALLQTAVFACLVVTVGSFFAVQPLIDLATHAANGLLFGR